MSEGKKIIISGACGNLGTKLKDHLELQGDYDFVLFDRDARGNRSTIEADLTRYQNDWAEQFTDADAVVHLAADPKANTTWASFPLNLDMVLNVFETAVNFGEKRLLFASSNHTMGGYKQEKVNLTPTTTQIHDTAYGVTKLVGERLAKSFADRHGLSVICGRIGWVQRGENNPGDQMGDWGRKMWLSNRDFCQLMEKAILTENVSFAALNAMSDNTDMLWDLNTTRKVIGSIPQYNAYGPEWT